MADDRSARPRRKRRKKDLVLVAGPTEDGEGLQILRKRAGHRDVEAGVLQPLKQGRAITGEVVRLEQRKEAPFLFDAETDHELSAHVAGSEGDHGAGDGDGGRPGTSRDPWPRARGRRDDAQRLTSTGPAQVASEEYRAGWDAIWGPRRRREPSN